MWQFFIDYPWFVRFTLSIVIATGSLFGTVRFGPVKPGPAGVLFAGLPPGIGPAVPAGPSVRGLAPYGDTVGLAAGPAL